MKLSRLKIMDTVILMRPSKIVTKLLRILDYIWSGQIGIFQMNPKSAYMYAFEAFRLSVF